MKKMVFTSLLGATALCLLSQLVSVNSFAADGTGTAKQFVIAALAITNTSDLDFGKAAPGDGAMTIIPDTIETSSNGSFAVTGQPDYAYTISIPQTPVQLVTGGGGANEVINVDSFTSYPLPGPNGLLDGAGAQNLFVGATRAALLPTQAPGAYVGTYTVTVVY